VIIFIPSFDTYLFCSSHEINYFWKKKKEKKKKKEIYKELIIESFLKINDSPDFRLSKT